MAVTTIQATIDGQMADHWVGDPPPLKTLEGQIGQRMQALYHPTTQVDLSQREDEMALTITVPEDIRATMSDETIWNHADGFSAGLSATLGIPERNIAVDIDFAETALNE